MKLIDKDAVLSEIKMYKDSLCDRNGNLENIEEEAKPDNSSTPTKTLGLHKRTNYKR